MEVQKYYIIYLLFKYIKKNLIKGMNPVNKKNNRINIRPLKLPINK